MIGDIRNIGAVSIYFACRKGWTEEHVKSWLEKAVAVESNQSVGVCSWTLTIHCDTSCVVRADFFKRRNLRPRARRVDLLLLLGQHVTHRPGLFFLFAPSALLARACRVPLFDSSNK